MKALTHLLFSTGVSFGILSLAGPASLLSFSLALWLSLSVNYLIDRLGHFYKEGRPTRSWVTHSLITAPCWGALVALVSTYALARLFSSGGGVGYVAFWVLMGVFVAAEHLFLDSLTQAGVYSWKRRVAIAHFRYDNVPLNLAFALIGALLVFVALR